MTVTGRGARLRPDGPRRSATSSRDSCGRTTEPRHRAPACPSPTVSVRTDPRRDGKSSRHNRRGVENGCPLALFVHVAVGVRCDEVAVTQDRQGARSGERQTSPNGSGRLSEYSIVLLPDGQSAFVGGSGEGACELDGAAFVDATRRRLGDTTPIGSRRRPHCRDLAGMPSISRCCARTHTMWAIVPPYT
jgi:hypothetical protein